MRETRASRVAGCSRESMTIQRASSPARLTSLLVLREAASGPYRTSSHALWWGAVGEEDG